MKLLDLIADFKVFLNHFALLPVAGAACIAGNAEAMHAVDLTSDGGFGYNNTFSVGWDFSITQSVTVTALGQFDPTTNAPQANTVAIYQRGGAKLAETSVLATSPAEASGNYSARYAVITPLVLPAGSYVVVSTQNTVDFVSPYGNPTATLGPGITWNKGVALGSGSAAGPLPATAPASWPIENTTQFRYFGPTFKYDPAQAATPTIFVQGALSGMISNYGTASPTPSSFTVSSVNLTAGITITPPPGFELSQGVGGASGYAGSGNSITVGSGGTIANTTIYVRLAANAPVGTYSGNITCSSMGATTQNVATVPSTVNPPGTFHALDVTNNGGSIGNGSGYCVGWEFTLSQAITVTALGQFDPTTPPQTNPVAIYQNVAGGGGAQLVSASVLNTSPAEGSGVCPARYAGVSSVVLPAGKYVIMSTQNGEDFIGPGGLPTATMGAGITWTNGVAFSGAAGPLPATTPASWQINNSSAVRYLGPTFKYATAAQVPPTQLAIPTVNGGSSPYVGTAFSVVVQARDASGNPQPVIATTAVNLSLKTGTGSLGGSVSGSITAGTSSVTINGITYTKAEGGVVLTATRTTGDNLTPANSAAFSVATQPPLSALGAVMPMGDSITLGVPVTGGYRDPLYTLLYNRGDTFTFVGSLTDNSTSLLSTVGQTHHEGHSGFVIAAGGGRSGLDENLAGWIGPSALAADKILLMIGSNDINLGYDMVNAPTRLNTLISHIYGYRPNVKLFVASIIPMVGHEPDVQAFNATIPAIVASHQALGRNVAYVPMYEGMNINTDLSDGLHPNALGYQHMAQAWNTALHLSNYSNWALANGVSDSANADSNHDGVQNGIAYFMRNAGRITYPGLDASHKVTWANGHNVPSSEYGSTFWVETSANLTDWVQVPVGDANLSNTPDSVSYTLPINGVRRFCRLAIAP